jgi:hypothetical protein
MSSEVPLTADGFGGDRYAHDVLAGFSHRPQRTVLPTMSAKNGLVLEEPGSGFVGAIVRRDKGIVYLEDRFGAVRAFPFATVFLVDGASVTLTAVVEPPAQSALARTASGSLAVTTSRARIAQPSRIFVEGRHDAELIEKVWGDDLRIEGVVVEYLDGVDDLESLVAEFAPTRQRRLGVLVDHLIPGSKETRIADSVGRGPYRAHVLVVGHPFVDIWQAVKPRHIGRDAWPVVGRETPWKHGVCEALGWPHADQADISRAWKRILGAVNSFADVEPELLGRVEHLIDFVTENTPTE